MLNKICSGAQCGADISALRTAKAYGIPTGGYAPYGWLTLKGTRPEYKEMYGMVECNCKGYPPRTEKNIVHSDGTLRFASDWASPGERCTLKFLEEHKKPYLDIDINSPPPVQAVKNWILDNKIEVLNVAGNSEFTSKGIERFVEKYLLELFSLLKEENDDVPF